MYRGVLLPISSAALSLVGLQLPAAECRENCTSPDKVCVCGLESDVQRTAARGRVFVIRLGSLEREPARFRTAVEVGDELVSSGQGAAVELNCPQGSSIKLSDTFRAVLLPPSEEQDCGFSLLSGTVNVLTGEPTQVQSGLIVMGSKRTQYGLRVSRRGEDVSQEAFAYDGDVEVRATAVGKTLPLQAGTKLRLQGSRFLRTTVTEHDVQKTANLYARMDVAKARMARIPLEDPDSVYSNLKASYARVLHRPADPESRLALAVQQVNLKISKQALYHLQKAEQQATGETRQLAVISLTKGMAYQELGDEGRAKQYYDNAKRIDPEVAKPSALKVYKFDDRLIRQVQVTPVARPLIVVKANANPSAVRPGGPAQIRVQALTREGKPIAGATVKVTAGGGLFRESSRTEVIGTTDARGGFQATWVCQPCARGYALHVEATKPGYQTGTAQVELEIRQAPPQRIRPQIIRPVPRG